MNTDLWFQDCRKFYINLSAHLERVANRVTWMTLRTSYMNSILNKDMWYFQKDTLKNIYTKNWLIKD